MRQKATWLGPLRLAARWDRGRAAPGAGRRPSQFDRMEPADAVASGLIVAACESSGSDNSPARGGDRYSPDRTRPTRRTDK